MRSLRAYAPKLEVGSEHADGDRLQRCEGMGQTEQKCFIYGWVWGSHTRPEFAIVTQRVPCMQARVLPSRTIGTASMPLGGQANCDMNKHPPERKGGKRRDTYGLVSMIRAAGL